MATLVIRREGFPPQYVPLTEERITIGRDAGCDLVLPSQFVSRYHAEVRQNGDSFELVDLDSRNGTALNGRRIQPNEPYALKNGDGFLIDEFTIDVVAEDSADTLQRAYRTGDELYVDVQAMEVWIGDRNLELRQARVLKLLAYMYANRGRVCTEDELGNHVWGTGQDAIPGASMFDSNSLHQLIYLARRAIESKPRQPEYLINVPGLGYRLHVRPQVTDGGGSE
ncbi:MAG TPA: FHA domain-containing protein [Dehalococcoidia bacterium]|nr:FHA domain-containing protein [Dehalococcoidia bacterium]